MKKLHKVLIVVAVAVVAVITGTTVVSIAGSEPAVEVQVVDENVAGMVKFEPSGVGSSLGGRTTEEIMAIYPGYLDYLREAQSQTVDVDLDRRSFTTQEIMAIYPGYLDSLRETQSQTVDIGPVQRNLTTEQIMAIYPGYLDYLREAQSQTVDVDMSELPFVPAIYFHP